MIRALTAFEREALGKTDMPWCEQCQGYHHITAEHIGPVKLRDYKFIGDPTDREVEASVADELYEAAFRLGPDLYPYEVTDTRDTSPVSFLVNYRGHDVTVTVRKGDHRK